MAQTGTGKKTKKDTIGWDGMGLDMNAWCMERRNTKRGRKEERNKKVERNKEK
jgi:hypothetical protein